MHGPPSALARANAPLRSDSDGLPWFRRSLASFLTEGGDGGEPMRRALGLPRAAGDSLAGVGLGQPQPRLALLAELPADAASRASSGGGGSGGALALLPF